MTKSEYALRNGIKNEPSSEQVDNLMVLAQSVLQPVRDAFKRGVKVNSGYRSKELNAAIGGAPDSDHCRGMAADIEIPGIKNYELASWIEKNLDYTQLILEFYTPGVPDSGWVHVSYNPKSLLGQSLTATKRGGKTVYLPGLVA